MTTIHTQWYKNGRLGEYNTILLTHSANHISMERLYDMVILLNFVEHIMNTFHVHNIVFQVLKPGGLIIFHERFWQGYDRRETRNKRELDLHPV